MALEDLDLRWLSARLRPAGLGRRAAERQAPSLAWRAGVGRRAAILPLRAAGDRRRGRSGSASAVSAAAAVSAGNQPGYRAGGNPADVRSAVPADEPAAFFPGHSHGALSAGTGAPPPRGQAAHRPGLGRLVAASRRPSALAAQGAAGAAAGLFGYRLVQSADRQP